MPDRNNDRMLQLVNRYKAAGEPWPAEAHVMAEWAVRSERWTPEHYSIVAHLADQMARAMRETYETDPQGRRVRALHVARVTRNGKQMSLWVGMHDREVPGHPHLMTIAFQQRRQQIVGDCQQLKTDVDSYNDNDNPGKQISIVFDFTADLEEAELMKSLRPGSSVAATGRSIRPRRRPTTDAAQRT